MIQAIETAYAGCLFRSRLEARWAVFFDTLGIQWEYEPQGFELPSGRYLPDFWLPSLAAWWEVKGKWPGLTSREWLLAAELAQGSGDLVYLAWGTPLNDDSGIEYFARENSDNGQMWCVCPWCGRIGIEYMAYGARICHHNKCTNWGSPRADSGYPQLARNWDQYDPDKYQTWSDSRLITAYRAARSARFEHGQYGAMLTPQRAKA